MKNLIITYLVFISISIAAIIGCTIAGIDIFKDNTGDTSHEHSYGEWQTVEEASCTKAGLKERACECGDKESEEIPLVAHSYTPEIAAPSCTEPGYTTYACACGDSYTADATEAVGHSYTSEVTAPTCTTDGCTTYTCGACGDTYTETIESEGHSYTSEVTAPTCTTDGCVTYTCSACGDSYKTDETPAIGHVYGEWTLSNPSEPTDTDTYVKKCKCGDTKTMTNVPKASSDLAMDYSAELGGYVVTGIGKCTDTDIVIPTHYQGPDDEKPLPVVAIASATDDDGSPIFGLSFMSNETITSLTIIGEVKTIGAFAFAQTNLKEINILGGVTTIDIQSFSFCYSVQTIVISDSVTNISDGAFFYAGFATGQSISVYYTGTEEQWKYVDIVYTEGDEAIKDATKYFYSETEPTEAGNYWHYVDGVVTVWPAV